MASCRCRQRRLPARRSRLRRGRPGRGRGRVRSTGPTDAADLVAAKRASAQEHATEATAEAAKPSRPEAGNVGTKPTESSDSVPNATFHWDAAKQHSSITVKSSTGTVTTDKYPGRVKVPWGGIENLNLPRIVNAPRDGFFSLDFSLPDPEAAKAYIDQAVEGPKYMNPPWNKETNSCITYCADVLRAGGLGEFAPGEPGTTLLRGYIPAELYEDRW